jgi:hypothetical protein
VTTPLSALALVALAAAGCGTESSATSADYTYEDAYLYDYYYPADVAYTSYYGAYAWDYPTLVDAGLGYSGSAATAAQRLAAGGALRALIRDQSMCPGQATVTPRTTTPPCAIPGTTAVRDGVNIVLDNCQITGGGSVSGTFDVQSILSTSAQSCTPATSIAVGFKGTITNLVYTSPDGGKIVTPSQVDNASTSVPFGQTPTSVAIDSTGELLLFNSRGTMLSAHTNSGTRTLTLSSGNRSYTIDGTVNVTDKGDGAAAVLAGTGVTRTQGCCRPTRGTLTVTRTGGRFPGSHTWQFRSTCGAATFDGINVTLPACI